MADIVALTKTALRRRAFLLGSALYCCNVLLVALLTSSPSAFLQFRGSLSPVLTSLGNAALWMLPAHAAVMGMVLVFFMESVVIDNPAHRLRSFLFSLLAPLIAGNLWGYCISQVLSGGGASSRELCQAALSAVLAVVAFTARRRLEQRHNYLIEASPSGAPALLLRFCGAVPVALRDSASAVLALVLTELGAGLLGAATDVLRGTLDSATIVTLADSNHAPIIQNLMSIVQVAVNAFLLAVSQVFSLCRVVLMLVKTLSSVGTFKGMYYSFLQFLIVYLMMSIAEEAMRLIILHPMKFSRLSAFDSPLATRDAQSTALADALSAILPQKMPSAQALLDRDPDQEISPGFTGKQRINVRVNSEVVSKRARRPHLWLETLLAQLDISDAMIRAVKPSATGHCPRIPALITPSAVSKGGSAVGFWLSGFDDAVLVLMRALAAHDLSRCARGLYALDCASAGEQSRFDSLSSRERDLLEDELSALPLVARDWCKVALSSCALIDAVSLQVSDESTTILVI